MTDDIKKLIEEAHTLSVRMVEKSGGGSYVTDLLDTLCDTLAAVVAELAEKQEAK